MAGLKVAGIVFAQHADIAGNTRGQHRRATAHRLHHHMGAAFYPAGVHQHMRALYVPARGCVRLAVQPAVQRACGGGCLSLLAQVCVQRLTDMVDKEATFARQQMCCFKQRFGRFFLAQMTHHQRAQLRACGRLVHWRQRGGGLENNTRLAAQSGWHGLGAALLQNHQLRGQCQGALSRCVGLDVFVEIGAGEYHRQPAHSRRARSPGGHRIG